MEAQPVRSGALSAFRVVLLLFCVLLFGCMERQGNSPKQRTSAPAGGAPTEGATARAQPAAESSSARPGAPAPISQRPTPPPPGPPADPFGADLDPDNDLVVAPPEAIPSCAEELTRAGVTFRSAEIPLKKGPAGAFTCGAHDAVVYQKGPTGLALSPPALLTCRMALAFVRLEAVMQEVARSELGTTIQRIQQMGTYSCRKMVRFDFVSEHSYGNAIDVGSFVLGDGRSVSVAKHFGKLDAEPPDARARFLRSLGNAAFDRNVVSVSLGPYWDTLHKDHFHFDMARYRVDGSRPQP